MNNSWGTIQRLASDRLGGGGGEVSLLPYTLAGMTVSKKNTQATMYVTSRRRGGRRELKVL